MNSEQKALTNTLCGLSGTLAGLSLAALAFLPADLDDVRSWLWGAAVLFALTSFRCLDKLMDNVSDDIGDDYKLWPKRGKTLFDKRITDFGQAIWPFGLAWLGFSIGMFHFGQHIGINPLLNYLGVGFMIAFTASLFIRPL